MSPTQLETLVKGMKVLTTMSTGMFRARAKCKAPDKNGAGSKKKGTPGRLEISTQKLVRCLRFPASPRPARAMPPPSARGGCHSPKLSVEAKCPVEVREASVSPLEADSVLGPTQPDLQGRRPQHSNLHCLTLLHLGSPLPGRAEDRGASLWWPACSSPTESPALASPGRAADISSGQQSTGATNGSTGEVNHHSWPARAFLLLPSEVLGLRVPTLLHSTKIS